MMRVLLLLVLSAATLTAQAPPSSTAIGEWPTYGGDFANGASIISTRVSGPAGLAHSLAPTTEGCVVDAWASVPE